MFRKRKNESVMVPKDIAWSRRADPARLAHELTGDFAGYGLSGIAQYTKRLKEIREGNKAFMAAELAASNGVVRGYHGTSAASAASIKAHGIQNRLNEEDRMGVSMWDEVAGQQALLFAKDRAREQGESGVGAVVLLEMRDPKIDRLGRLEWLGNAEDTRVLEVYTPEEFLSFVGDTALANH